MPFDPPPTNVAEYAMMMLGADLDGRIRECRNRLTLPHGVDRDSYLRGETYGYGFVKCWIAGLDWSQMQETFDKEDPNA